MKLWLARQRYLIDFTVASLARRKTRNLGLLFGLYGAGVHAGLGHALHPCPAPGGGAGAGRFAGIVIVQRMVAGRHDLIPPGYI
jgi:lipoprotein-releasing system permease protein